jgi:very-short-patch-repair endonuclease
VYQEYPVKKINPDFYSGKCKYDWAILDMKVIIEVMGEQHYQPVRWSRQTSKEESVSNFEDIKYRDQQKKKAALEAGYTYLAIPYSIVREGIDIETIMNMISDNAKEEVVSVPKKKGPATPVWMREKHKEIRKAQYRRSKEWFLKQQGSLVK